MEVAEKPKNSPVNVGNVYGLLTVESFVGSQGGRAGLVWRCRCACGNTTLRSTHDLRRIQNASCGCSKKRHEWTDELDNEVAEMRATLSIAEIANRIGRPYEAVRSRLRLLDTPVSRRSPRKASKPEKLGYLELAPGNFAVDARSYELITGKSA